MSELIAARRIVVSSFATPVTDEIGASKTGTWRSAKPVWRKMACKPCNICDKYCPDGVVSLTSAGTIEIDYEYCKGCGICAVECPRGAIEMLEE